MYDGCWANLALYDDRCLNDSTKNFMFAGMSIMSGMCDGNNSDATASGLGQPEQLCSCCELNCVQVCTFFFAI